ncbi:hypothetical protein BaRGS_00012547 [Batillaria attramentaria]|uniref:Uncharacterized protein n=1 Tax=Batillaria attramentaria TaxID=370345 RepID=A0ABD0LAG9_9CAEN
MDRLSDPCNRATEDQHRHKSNGPCGTRTLLSLGGGVSESERMTGTIKLRWQFRLRKAGLDGLVKLLFGQGVVPKGGWSNVCVCANICAVPVQTPLIGEGHPVTTFPLLLLRVPIPTNKFVPEIPVSTQMKPVQSFCTHFVFHWG